MNRLDYKDVFGKYSVPRSRGDEPHAIGEAAAIELVFPAHAGMNR